MFEVKHVVLPHFAVALKFVATIAAIVESAIFAKTSSIHCSLTLLNNSFCVKTYVPKTANYPLGNILVHQTCQKARMILLKPAV